jgi:spore coat protein U-like protein
LTTLNGQLDVSATVVTSCVLTNANVSLTFANFNPTGPAVTATTPIGVTCNNGVGYTLALGDGLNAVSGVRRMNDGGAGRLEYTLSRPDALNVNTLTAWGGANLVSRTGNGSNQDATVFGTITAGGNNATVLAGAYSDTVVISLTF